MSRLCKTCHQPVPSKRGLMLDFRRMVIHRGGRAFPMSNRDFLILQVLARSLGEVVSHEAIERAASIAPGQFKKPIWRLRRRLGADRIRTMVKVGYALRGPVKVIR